MCIIGRYTVDQDTEFCCYHTFCTGPDARFSSKSTISYRRVRTAQGRGAEFCPSSSTVRGVAVERRSAKRDPIRVEIDIAHPGAGLCHGLVENISKSGVSLVIHGGSLPAEQRSVILNFRVWTGTEMLYRKIYCRVVRREVGRMALEFAEDDIVSEAIIQDLMFYQNRARKQVAPVPFQGDSFAGAVAPEVTGP